MATPPLASKHDKRRPPAMLDIYEEVPCTIEPWQAVAPVRPDTAHVRALRYLDLGGEIVSALIIIAGGVLAYGFMPIV